MTGSSQIFYKTVRKELASAQYIISEHNSFIENLATSSHRTDFILQFFISMQLL